MQKRSKYKRFNRHKLDQNVQGWSRGILQWITNSVTNDGGLVGFRSLSSKHTSVLASSGLEVLLGVIPSTTGVGGGNGHLNSRDQRSDNQWGEDDEGTWWSHLGKRSLGGNLDTLLVVWLASSLHQSWDDVELTSNFLHHGEGSAAHTLHGHGTEPERQHSSDKESWEDLLVQNGAVGKVKVGTGDVGSEEGQGHQGSRSDGESLSDSSGGVTCGIEGVGSITDLLTHLSHLGDTSGVIGDRTVGINGKTGGQRSQHTEGRAGNSVHTRASVGEVDSHPM